MKTIIRWFFALLMLGTIFVLVVAIGIQYNNKTGDLSAWKKILSGEVTPESTLTTVPISTEIPTQTIEPTATPMATENIPSFVTASPMPDNTDVPTATLTATPTASPTWTPTAIPPTSTATLTSTSTATEVSSIVPEITGTPDTRPYGLQTRSAVQTQAAK